MVMKHFYLTYSFICLWFFATAMAQVPSAITSEYSYKHYTTEDGLPSILNQCMYQDKHGFVWIASTCGLSRFDGFKFNVFLKGQFANLYHLDEDEKGNIRAFSNKYMYVIDSKADTLRKTILSEDLFLTTLSSQSLPNGYGIFYTKNETENVFCAIRDTGIIKLIRHEDLNKLEDRHKAYYDEQKKYLYIPLDDGISVISAKGRIAFHKGIRAMCFIQYKNALWAIASDGLYRMEKDGFHLIISNIIDKYTGDVIAHADAEGALLFKDYNTLYRYSNNQIEKVFTANVISDFLVDREGNIWLTTYQGIYNLFRLQFRNYVLADKTDVVRCVVYQPSEKNILAGTLNGSLFEISKEKIKQMHYPPNPYDAAFFDAYGAVLNNMSYLPGPGDLLQLKNGKFRWLSLPFHDPYFFVSPLPDGTLLTGGSSRLFRVTPEGKVLKEFNQEQLEQRVYAKPCVGKTGKNWLGGVHGVCVMEDDSIIKTYFNEQTKLCRVMNNDHQGNTWFASDNRLFKSDDKDSIQLVKILDNVITGILFTHKDQMIISSLGGIHIFDKEKEHFVFYNHQNGYTGIEPTRSEMAEDSEGNVWLPSVGGLVCFNPDKLLYQQPKPLLQLLSVSSSKDNINWSKEDTVALSLNYNQNNIHFNYIGLSYSSAQNVRYQYRLIGFQEEWSNPVSEREITFNNLSPGKYQFQLKASAGTDNTDTAVQTFSFEIKPALWQTWTFRIIFGILIIGLTGWIIFIYLKKKHEKEIRKANREKEMNELRVQSIRLKSIPHFNSNVLAGIEYLILTNNKEDANHLLSVYSIFTNKTLHEIDKAQRSLKDEIDYTLLYLELEKMRYGDKLSYDIKIDEGVNTAIMIPNMVLHTYTENAIKHGIRGKNLPGKVTIHVTKKDSGILICVEDNGIGREAARLRNPERKGQGLQILLRQIELYNQQNKEKIVQTVIDLLDAEGNPAGTRFELYVPHHYQYL